MNLPNNQNLLRWIMIIASFVIISLILWNTYIFFQNFKAEERTKMKNWSFAQQELNKSIDLDANIGDLHLQIIQSNTSTPMVVVGSTGKIQQINNIDARKSSDSTYLYSMVEKFKRENSPIEIRFKGEVLQTLYYGNSPLLNKLKYYPLALVLIIFLFAAVVYFFYKSSKTAVQNKLWSGMAKETAHQIGTPLSSLVGWTEILKSENVNPDHLKEIEKDVNRLQTITDRFSKIGSAPKLKKTNIVEATHDAYTYLQARSSKLINFSFEGPEEEIMVSLNEQLYSWTIENLVKNAIDAMKGEGELKVEVLKHDKYVNILVSDTGKGMAKKKYRPIFEPGYTSKKRGWGLGLSLAKRIIEDYHNGKIKVLDSEINKGTIMQISLKTI
jgi:hypothetical protein